MKNDWEAGKLLANLLKNIKTKLRLLAGLKFVCAVACTDSDCKRVTACSCGKIVNLLRLCIGGVFSVNLNIVLNAGKGAKLALNNNAVSVSVFNKLFGKGNILFVRKR